MKSINSNSNCEQNKLYSRLTKLGLLYKKTCEVKHKNKDAKSLKQMQRRRFE